MANVADQDVIELEVVIAGGTATVVNEARNPDKQRRVVHIRKFTNGQDVSEAPGPLIPVGSPVTWTCMVTNTSASTF